MNDLGVFYDEVIKLTEKQREFEQRLDLLIVIRDILIKDNEFDEATQREYLKLWDRTFDLLEE